jgi:hypothetical protein
MTDRRAEQLVLVADPARYEEVVAALRATIPVVQQLPPRLATVGPLPAGRPPPRVSGVRWYDEAPPDDEDLSAPERLFVAAWLARRRPKDRPGDGLPWDAPGHLPPDAPA